jgi:hypothetical protein
MELGGRHTMIEISPWFIGILIAIAGLSLTFVGVMYGRRKDRESKIVKDTTERSEVRLLLKGLAEGMTAMDRSINATLSEMKGQYNSVETCTRDHEGRLVRVEESTKSAHRRIDELKN